MKFKTLRWEEIYKRLPKDRNIIGAEVGVWGGKTSNYLLANLPLLTIYMIDLWDDPSINLSFFNSGAKMAKFPKEAYDKALEQVRAIQSNYPDRAYIIQDFSVNAAHQFEDNSLDWVFIDDDHSYEGISKSSDAWIPKVKTGGLVAWHDYHPLHRGFKGVRQAIDERFSPEELDLGDDHTVFWIKR